MIVRPTVYIWHSNVVDARSSKLVVNKCQVTLMGAFSTLESFVCVKMLFVYLSHLGTTKKKCPGSFVTAWD